MTDLATRAELVKLARALGTTDNAVDQLAHLPADDLRSLRSAVAAHLFDSSAHRFERLAEVSNLAPAALAATIGERALGALISARIAALVAPARAVQMARSMSTPFLADVAVDLDAAHAQPLLRALPVEILTEVAHELLGRQDHITLAAFVEHIDPDDLAAVAATIEDDAALLQVGFYLGTGAAVDRVVAAVPAERLARLVHLTVTGTPDERVAGLSLAGRAGDDTRRQLADLALAGERDDALRGMVDTAVEHGAVAELVMLVGHASPEHHGRVDELIHGLEGDVLRTVARDALTGSADSRVAAVFLLEQLGDEARESVLGIIVDDLLDQVGALIRDTVGAGATGDLLRATSYLSPHRLAELTSGLMADDPWALEGLLAAGVRDGHWTLLAGLVERLGHDRTVPLLRDLGELDDGGA